MAEPTKVVPMRFRDHTSGGEPPGGNGLEKRVEALEGAMVDIRERLARIETKADSIERHSATKQDLSSLEATMIKWYVATAFAMTGLTATIVFAVAKMLAKTSA